MNILIVHENVLPFDAIGNDIEIMYRILKDDYNCLVYARNKKNKNVRYAEDRQRDSILNDESSVIIYHLSVFWEEGYDLLRKAKGRIIIRYHNITPAEYFGAYSVPHYEACLRGRRQLEAMQSELKKAFWFPASGFNARDLRYVDNSRIFIVPPFNKIDEWGRTEPDEETLKSIMQNDAFNLLFVGRMVPNKGYLFMAEVLRYYCHYYDDRIKLHIIGGREEALSDYCNIFSDRIRQYGLEDKIEFAGQVDDRRLTAYYKGCDAFLCTSYHEGFCVPVAEAQYFKLPVIGLRYCAVPETAGDSQLMLGPDPADFAAAIHLIGSKKEYSDFLSEKGWENYEERFSLPAIKSCFDKAFKTVLAPPIDIKESGAESQERMRVAFVAPWFGEKIPGGAESELRTVANALKRAGIEVEILSTRVKAFSSDWSLNYYPFGTEIYNGIPITRFDVKKRDNALFDSVNAKLMKGEMVGPEEGDAFVREMVNSPGLYDYIREHNEDYDLFVFIPYMFGTSYYGLKECEGRAVMIPCLHNESYAYLPQFKEAFQSLSGMIFLSAPEQKFANSVYDLSGVKQLLAGGIVDTDITYDTERFRNKYKIPEPFLLYAGRKDSGKGVDELVEYFQRYKKNHANALKLVLIGGGSIHVAGAISKDVIDLGFVDVQDKYDAYSTSLCLCQLSKMESFSIVIMESWLCGRPVIVNKACSVTTDFAENFEGGFAIGDYKGFEDSVDFFLDNPDKASVMGINGRDIVRENFTEEIVAGKYIRFFRELIEHRKKEDMLNIEDIMCCIRRSINNRGVMIGDSQWE